MKVSRKTTHVLPIFLLLCLCVISGSVQVVSRQEGDIMLGALFPIHAKGSSPEGCGPLQVNFQLFSRWQLGSKLNPILVSLSSLLTPAQLSQKVVRRDVIS